MLEKKKFYINGKWTDPFISNHCNVIDPSTEEAFAVISLGGMEDTNLAVLSAKNALSSWSSTSKEEKIFYLEKLHAVYQKRIHEMAEAISFEMGCPIDMSLAVQAQTGLDHIEDFINQLKQFSFEEPFNASSNNHIIYEPIGVCGLITPWNWPMNQLALKGVFNLVNGDGQGVGTYLSGHQDIDMISFTGSTRAGKLISINAADTIKRVCLELGGKGGNIVFADSYPNAVRDGVRNVMSNSGQSCDAPTRMLIQRTIYEKAVKEAIEEANSIKVGLASNKGNHIGPVVSKTQYNKIIDLIQSGIKEGATLAAGGIEKPDDLKTGYFIKPTIFTDVTNEMNISKSEIFGPVLSIIPFDTEEEAIEIVNSTEYGLGNYIQTEDREKAHRVAKQLRSGIVYINGEYADVGTPFGGYRQSGNGREGGKWGLSEFLEVKNITGWKS